MNSTDGTLEFCPICKNAIVVDTDKKYCIICGYVPPQFSEETQSKMKEFANYLVPDGIADIAKQVPTFPEVRSDGIYIPLTDSVPEGCIPNYRLLISKDMFIHAYFKYIAPLLEGESEK